MDYSGKGDTRGEKGERDAGRDGERERERGRNGARETEMKNRGTRQRVRPPSRLHTTSSIPSLHTQLQLHRGSAWLRTCETARGSPSLSRACVRLYGRVCNACACINIYLYCATRNNRVAVVQFYRDAVSPRGVLDSTIADHYSRTRVSSRGSSWASEDRRPTS